MDTGSIVSLKQAAEGYPAGKQFIVADLLTDGGKMVAVLQGDAHEPGIHLSQPVENLLHLVYDPTSFGGIMRYIFARLTNRAPNEVTGEALMADVHAHVAPLRQHLEAVYNGQFAGKKKGKAVSLNALACYAAYCVDKGQDERDIMSLSKSKLIAAARPIEAMLNEKAENAATKWMQSRQGRAAMRKMQQKGRQR